MSTNCWQVKKCGREPGGLKAAELGVCPAGTTVSGSNQGTNSGRICWAIAGTFCGGRTQGTFAQKAANCMQCEFYRIVKSEEGTSFVTLPIRATKTPGR